MKQEKILSESEALRMLESSARLSPLMRLRAIVLKLRYQLWLVLLREISIRKVLIENYAKIPENTFTRMRIAFYVKFSMMKNLLSVLERRLRRKIY